MEIITIVAGILETNCYLITSPESRTAILIDAPPESAEMVSQELKKRDLSLESILLTHTHWDHTADAEPIKKATKAMLYVSKLDYYRIQEPMKHTLMPLYFEIKPVEADYLISKEELLTFGSIELLATPTPGHTEGGLTFVFKSRQCAFVGDTIFYRSVGRWDLPGGDEKTLLESIRNKIFALPDDFTLYPGHGITTTVGFEKKNNVYVLPI
ncbi:MAG: MBL fold metallo-hydrolase [Candidatus Kapaibacteriales bacterium]